MTIIDDLKAHYKMSNCAQKMIFLNIALFIITLLLDQFSLTVFYQNWFALSSSPQVVFSRPWTLLTYAFLHDGIMHLFFNMLLLQFSGQLFLTYFSEKQWLGLYVLSAIFSGILFSFIFYFSGYTTSIVGASAAIMAILVASTTFNPYRNIQLLLIGNVRLWHITFVIIIIDVLQFKTDNTGGHIAHLAGAIFGFIYVFALKKGLDFSKIVTSLIAFVTNGMQPSNTTPFKKVHRNYNNTIKSNVQSKIVTKNKKQQQIDEILDKISKSGYDSLSDNEKDFLFKAGRD